MIQSKISQLLLRKKKKKKNCLHEVFCFSRAQKEVTHTIESKSERRIKKCPAVYRTAQYTFRNHSSSRLFMPFLLFQHDETETGP